MNNPNPINVILWTLRRNEEDVVNLYNYLSGLMQIATGGNFLNFGYWDESTKNPIDAQSNLCNRVEKMAQLEGAKNILDVGSGFSEPALLWKKNHPDIEITCLNTNSNQLKFANATLNHAKLQINLLNSTATKIPFASQSQDRIIALESAQHFKPIDEFISEAKRVLKKDGIIIVAIPVLSNPAKSDLLKIGILKFTWSSEHYDLETIKNAINDAGLNIIETQMIGSRVYAPLAEYYIKNHELLREKILRAYPAYVEKILFKSMLKMKQAATDNTIEYALVKCTK